LIKIQGLLAVQKYTKRGTETAPQNNISENRCPRDTRTVLLKVNFDFFATFLHIYGELFAANANCVFFGDAARSAYRPKKVLPSWISSSASVSFFLTRALRLLTI